MNWQPTAGFDTIRRRAKLLADIRHFFDERQVLEVTTPALSPAGTTDPNIQSITLNLRASPQQPLRYLHTSPELAMKRLLAAGSGPIYQLCTVFRDNPLGRFHRPEFTMLEWYRPGWQYHALIAEVLALIGAAAYEIKFAEPQRLSYRELFRQYAGLDPVQATADDCRETCRRNDLPVAASMTADIDEWLDWILSALVAPRLPTDRLTCVYDFPPTQAALARIRADSSPVAERFEIFWGALELANGFQELTNPEEQQRRFVQDNLKRRQKGFPEIRIDEYFLAAMQAGLPESAGVALGVDRLLLAITGAGHIREVVAFADDNE
ncbi:MAG TPA: EF-P lysine aminoacylase EpmA [Gammaproteobacteria bacterium]